MALRREDNNEFRWRVWRMAAKVAGFDGVAENKSPRAEKTEPGDGHAELVLRRKRRGKVRRLARDDFGGRRSIRGRRREIEDFHRCR